MDLINKMDKIDSKFLASLILGGVTITSLALYIQKLKSELKLEKKYSLLRPKSSIKELIGKTPILKLESLSKLTGCDIYVKMENQNPGRSVKDRAALHIVEDALNSGELKQGGTLYESTSGSTGISLGIMCGIHGLKCRIFLNDDLAQEKVMLPFSRMFFNSILV